MRFMAIDWSGAKRPAGKIWLAEAANGELRRTEALQSRDEATLEIIRCCLTQPDLVVGLDFAFSMPHWFLKSQGLTTAFELWALAELHGEQWLQECSSPFWGRPGKRKPPSQGHYRRTEEDIVRANRIAGIAPKSCFQIGGAGAVGTGSIRGMPALRRIHEAGISIWQFDRPTFPLVVEIYPRLLTGPVKKTSATARAHFLDQRHPRLRPRFRSQAVQSEDAFDAIVSALVMDQHRTELAALRPITEAPYQTEGLIWAPTR